MHGRICVSTMHGHMCMRPHVVMMVYGVQLQAVALSNNSLTGTLPSSWANLQVIILATFIQDCLLKHSRTVRDKNFKSMQGSEKLN